MAWIDKNSHLFGQVQLVLPRMVQYHPKIHMYMYSYCVPFVYLSLWTRILIHFPQCVVLQNASHSIEDILHRPCLHKIKLNSGIKNLLCTIVMHSPLQHSTARSLVYKTWLIKITVSALSVLVNQIPFWLGICRHHALKEQMSLYQ